MIWIIAISVVASAIYVIRRFARGKWRISENGNPTRIYKGLRISVFPSDGGWKFCVAEPADDDSPYFSESYESQQAAMESGLALVNNVPSPHKTRRQIRKQKQLSESLKITAQSSVILADAKDKLLRMHEHNRFLIKEIEPIIRECKLQSGCMVDVYQDHLMEDRDHEADLVWQERAEFISLQKHCEEILTWLRSTPKSERGDPPSLDLK